MIILIHCAAENKFYFSYLLQIFGSNSSCLPMKKLKHDAEFILIFRSSILRTQEEMSRKTGPGK